MEPIRKRYFVEGEAVPATEQHAQYIKPAMKLLEQVRVEMGELLQGQQHLRRVMLADGAQLEAHWRHGQGEIHINLPRSSKSGDKKSEKDERKPYLWIGARYAWERMGPDAWHEPDSLIVAVFEPSIDGVPQGIVCNVPVFEYPEGIGATGGFSWQGYAEANPRPPEVLSRWWSNTFIDAEGYQGNVQVSQHGLYMTAMSMPFSGANNFTYYGPGNIPAHWGNMAGPRMVYDPRATPEEIAARPWGVWSEDVKTDWFPEGGPLWDVVAVLDPDPTRAPSDSRDDMLNIGQMLETLELPTGEGQIIPGKYAIKIGSAAPCYGPAEVDLEVRVLKGPYTITKRFELTVPYGSGLYMNMTPYGQVIPDHYSFCPHESGGNPHANWWQGAVLVDPRAGTAKRVEQYVPEHGFTPRRFLPGWECGGWDFPAIYIGIHFLADQRYVDFYPQVVARCAEFYTQNYPWGSPEDYPLTPENYVAYESPVMAAALRDVQDVGMYRYIGQWDGGPRFERLDVSHTYAISFEWAEEFLPIESANGKDLIVAHVVQAYTKHFPTGLPSGGCPAL